MGGRTLTCGLGAAHARHAKHLRQSWQHLVGARPVEKEKAKVSTKEAISGAAEASNAKEVGGNRLERDEHEGGDDCPRRAKRVDHARQHHASYPPTVPHDGLLSWP